MLKAVNDFVEIKIGNLWYKRRYEEVRYNDIFRCPNDPELVGKIFQCKGPITYMEDGDHLIPCDEVIERIPRKLLD